MAKDAATLAPDYETQEALGILAKLRGENDPRQTLPTEAAKRLLSVFVSTLREAGFQVRDTEDDGDPLLDEANVAMGNLEWVQIVCDRRGLSLAYKSRRTPSDVSYELAKLDFDWNERRFVGVEDDTFFEPTPGAPRRKQGALTVVSNLFAGMVKARRDRPST